MINTYFNNILIVEDEFLALEYLKDILSRLGFENILESKNGNDAISLCKNNEIDIIFMDINISGNLDGITCAREINQNKNIPIIYTTAYVDDETILEANTTNIFGYIMKPFNLKDVQSILLTANTFMTKQKQQDNKYKKLLGNKDTKNIVLLQNNYSYNFITQTMKYYENSIHLTKREVLIIELFCNNINEIVHYDLLKENIWQNENIASSTIRDAVSRLKKKLIYLDIKNIVNVGYKLEN